MGAGGASELLDGQPILLRLKRALLGSMAIPTSARKALWGLAPSRNGGIPSTHTHVPHRTTTNAWILEAGSHASPMPSGVTWNRVSPATPGSTTTRQALHESNGAAQGFKRSHRFRLARCLPMRCLLWERETLHEPAKSEQVSCLCVCPARRRARRSLVHTLGQRTHEVLLRRQPSSCDFDHRGSAHAPIHRLSPSNEDFSGAGSEDAVNSSCYTRTDA